MTTVLQATVGAGLPIIATLKHLRETGDRIISVEGIFSGTLSYLFNAFGTDDRPFSQIVQEAKEAGFTEPDPRDDLSGMDVARKVRCYLPLSFWDVLLYFSLVSHSYCDAPNWLCISLVLRAGFMYFIDLLPQCVGCECLVLIPIEFG